MDVFAPDDCDAIVIRADATVLCYRAAKEFSASWVEELLNADQFLVFTKEVAREP